MLDDGVAQWFVIRSNQRQERLACTALKADQVETYLPMIVRSNRKGEVFGAPMFPSYLFARLPMRSKAWRDVFTARGVSSVLSWGGRVRPLADRVIDAIREREHDGFVRMSLDAEPVHRFERGELVTIKKGPFAALPAVFQEPLDERRCLVLISLIGETQRVAKTEYSHIAA
jgi:transcription elongation factor/antiterminator RfaH